MHLSAMLLLLTPIADQSALPPLGPWRVEAEENLCLLSHAFGTESAKVLFGLQPLFAAPIMELIVITPGGSRQQYVGKTKVTFASGATLDGDYASVPVKNSRRLARLTVPSEAYVMVAREKTVRLQARGLDVQLNLPPANKAVQVFDQCQRTLLQSWGIDPKPCIRIGRPSRSIRNESFVRPTIRRKLSAMA